VCLLAIAPRHITILFVLRYTTYTWPKLDIKTRQSCYLLQRFVSSVTFCLAENSGPLTYLVVYRDWNIWSNLTLQVTSTKSLIYSGICMSLTKMWFNWGLSHWRKMVTVVWNKCMFLQTWICWWTNKHTHLQWFKRMILIFFYLLYILNT